MIKKILILFYLFFIGVLNSYEISLEGIFKQGGFFKSVLPDEVIKFRFNDRFIPIYNHFIFVGLERNQPEKNYIVIYFQNSDSLYFLLNIEKQDYPTEKIKNLPNKYVKTPQNKKLLDRITKEYNKLSGVKKNIIYKNNHKFFSEFRLPLIYRISSEFGVGRILNSKKVSYHKGVDFAAPKGADVLACANGIVVLTGDYFYSGKFVLIDHGLGISSIYLHLSKILVMPGEFVDIGDKIGEVGSSGRATGNHLHWGIYWYEIPINPLFITKSILEKRKLK